MNTHEAAELHQAEGFSAVRNGLPEMACTAGDEPAPGLLARLWRWLMRPICNL